jgi:asparagine synthase (glutamine-hydrolysing)
MIGWEEVILPVEGVSLGERPFFFRRDEFPLWRKSFRSWDEGQAVGSREIASRIAAGKFLFYSRDERSVGFPPSWHHNHYTDEVVPSDLHWSRLPDFGYGDIKNVWELNRFGWVFPLVRAYARDGEVIHGETFERLLEDWMRQNPPNRGANWKCGQEVSFRLMAVLWGWFGLGQSAQLGDSVRRLAWVSGKRIEANIEYALQQYNNHGISEAAGLWTIGLLFPEFAESARWKALGRSLLEKHASTLVYEDGGCSQASFNYERVMLDVLIWSARLGDLHGEPLGEEVMTAVGRAAELMFQCQDSETGRLPNYGANDGAHILPLSNADYLDYRPALQSAFMLTEGGRCYDCGSYDESMLWLFGAEALTSLLKGRRRTDFNATVSGYHTLRNAKGFLFMRCGAHWHRPSHADQLHVDLWWRGENVAMDAGTYSYNAAKPFDEGFKGTRFHNTVVVDGKDQMDKASRFLWLPWVRGTLKGSGEGRLLGEHDGFVRLPDSVRHRRQILRVKDHGFLVLDHLRGRGESHDYEVRWQLPGKFASVEGGDAVRFVREDETYFVQLWNESPEFGASWTHAVESASNGWRSRYYMQREAGGVLSGRSVGDSAVFVTWLGDAWATFDAKSSGDEMVVKVADETVIVPKDLMTL